MPISPRQQQNLFLDAVVSGRIHTKRQSRLSAAASLRPGAELAIACAANNETAMAIRDCWKFSFPITTMEPDEFDQMVERGHCTFEGRMGDRR